MTRRIALTVTQSMTRSKRESKKAAHGRPRAAPVSGACSAGSAARTDGTDVYTTSAMPTRAKPGTRFPRLRVACKASRRAMATDDGALPPRWLELQRLATILHAIQHAPHISPRFWRSLMLRVKRVFALVESHDTKVIQPHRNCVLPVVVLRGLPSHLACESAARLCPEVAAAHLLP